eukprot:m.97732 g.97732  ORF g.97732 m.97732 type:complete len:252 (-) comp14842_c1_seq1:531-1286(-)
MSARVFTPVNQKLLTNVAVVRQRKGGMRFEIACFRNKVVSWRKKIETDLDEVLQIHSVFTNVSKGQVAKKADLMKAYKTDDEKAIILEILAKGELQVSKEERDTELADKFKEVATIVSEKCINPDTRRPYVVAQIERAMKDIHFSVNPNVSPKSQALEVIRQLQQVIPLERAQMTIRVVMPVKEGKAAKEAIKHLFAEVESEDFDEDLEIVARVDPGAYRQIDEIVCEKTKGKGVLEILSVKNVEEGDQAL